MLGSQIIDNGYHDSINMVGGPHPSPHSLAGTVKRFLNKDLTEKKKELQRSFIDLAPDTPMTEEQLEYAGGDVEHLIPLYHAQQKHIEERGLSKIIKLENTLTPVLVKTEFNGCLIDQEKHKENIKDWGVKLKEKEALLDSEIIKLARHYPRIQGGKYTNSRKTEHLIQLDLFGGEGYEVKNLNIYNINYSSPKQIQDLFDRTDCVKPTDDTGKVSFGENSIKTYINNNPQSHLKTFLEVLLEFREYSKLLGTYGSKLLTVLDQGRMRTTYGQCFTDTGRLNSSEVLSGQLGANLANIPKRADIRSIFIPDPGYSFIDSDMSGQEVLIAGDFSKEPTIMKAFQENFDLHSYLSSISYSIIFNQDFQVLDENKDIKVGEFTYNLKKLRTVHKSCLFAKFYGGGKMRVMNVLNEYLVNHWPPDQREFKADQISKALDRALPILSKFLKGVVEQCQREGYVVANKLGRRRYFDNALEAYGEIMNLKIQATGADSIKIALINIDKWLGEKSNELGIPERELGYIVMSIYDQNLICLNDKYLDLAPEIPRIMSESISYFLEDLKGSSDLQIKKHWSK